MTPPPGTRLDRYEVERLLATGGTGVVLRVRHSSLGSLHALKLLHTGSEAARHRLWREGRIQASLRHPNLLAVTDVVSVGDDVGLVMDLVSGPDLGTWSGRHRPAVEEVDALAEQLFAGVGCAHAARVVHRDLKPENVLVQRDGDNLRLRVADFGLAVALSEIGPRLTQTGQALGTPRYMAPEQYRDGGSVDHRADVFALGAMLYELLAGRPAFDEISVLSAWEAASTGKFPPLAARAPDAPPRMVAAVEAALSPDPEDRPASVEDLRARWRDGTPPPVRAWSAAALAAARPAEEPSLAPLAPTRSLPAAPRAAPPPRRLLGALAGVGLLVGVGAVAWSRPDPPTPASTPPPPTSAPDPGPADSPAAEVSAAAESAPAPTPTTASVRVNGIRRARLLDAAGRSWAPADDLPPGTYQLEAWFDDGDPVPVLALKLRAGSSRVVRCEPTLRVCR